MCSKQEAVGLRGVEVEMTDALIESAGGDDVEMSQANEVASKSERCSQTPTKILGSSAKEC